MPGLDGFTVRPQVGTHRVDVICGRCKGPVRDLALSGVATVADIVAAADAHQRRLHRGPVITVHLTPAGLPL
jgi:hypothetical protein